MTPSTPPPAPSASKAAAPTVALPAMGRAKTKMMPPKLILNAVEGWGKTTMGAYAPEPFILMASGETGYTTLLGAKRVPEIDTILDDSGKPRVAESWLETLSVLDYFIANKTSHKTFVLDALGGFERLCHEHVCNRDFKGEWGEKGFASYQKGYDVSVAEWQQLLRRLETINAGGITIIMLSHCMVRPFKNPLGEDFDRYVTNLHHKTWGPTVKWADAVLFGNFITVVDPKGGRARGIGGTDRIIYTERRDAYDAKNRFGMPEAIEIPNDPTQIWSTVYNAIKGQ